MKKKKTKKQTPAQQRAREQSLLSELCTDHGYTFSDSLPSKDKITFLMRTMPNGKRMISAAPVVKLMVPDESALGRVINAGRKERNPATNKSAMAREKARATQGRKMRPLAKIGAGPS